jgi:amidase
LCGSEVRVQEQLGLGRIVAVGTETDGSIVCPASVNGIILGIKPTVGFSSRLGLFYFTKHKIQPGPYG